jgi:serine/threonine-protein kinase
VALPSIAPGTLFGPRWIIGRVLGKSELAVVYEAEEAREARFAALKLLEPVLARDVLAWERFQEVTRTLARVQSNGIAKSYDVGMNESRPFFATERTVFPTLSRFIAERGPLTPHAFSDALGTLAGALDAAHAAGIVHGNLKPQNVFVSFDNAGWARLTDFGLAELRAANHVPNPRTLGWNAPEVTPASPIFASDLYCLGLLSFFALSGTPWFSAQRATTASGTPRPLLASERAKSFGGEISPSLDAWFARALDREPEKRFPNAASMARAFVEAMDGPRPAPPDSRFPLSETVPVREANPALRAALAAAANAPTVPTPSYPAPSSAPTLEITAPLTEAIAPVVARYSQGSASAPPAVVSYPPSASHPPNASHSPVPSHGASAAKPPVAVIAIAVGAVVLGAVLFGTLLYVLLR